MARYAEPAVSAATRRRGAPHGHPWRPRGLRSLGGGRTRHGRVSSPRACPRTIMLHCRRLSSRRRTKRRGAGDRNGPISSSGERTTTAISIGMTSAIMIRASGTVPGRARTNITDSAMPKPTMLGAFALEIGAAIVVPYRRGATAASGPGRTRGDGGIRFACRPDDAGPYGGHRLTGAGHVTEALSAAGYGLAASAAPCCGAGTPDERTWLTASRQAGLPLYGRSGTGDFMRVARVRLHLFRGYTEQVIMPSRHAVVVGEPRAGSPWTARSGRSTAWSLRITPSMRLWRSRTAGPT